LHFSIVIPFHNESANLPELHRRLKNFIDERNEEIEVLFINDASEDDSVKILQQCISNKKTFKLFSLQVRGGQTGAFKLGFAEALGANIIRMDADLQDHPEDLAFFFEKLEAGYDVVLGYRVSRSHNIFLKLLTTIYDSITTIIFDTGLKSNSGSFVGFSSHLVKNIPFHNNDHRYLPLICLQRGAKTFCGIAVNHSARNHGRSKYSNINKCLFGFIEFVMFYLRFKRGYYRLINNE